MPTSSKTYMGMESNYSKSYRTSEDSINSYKKYYLKSLTTTSVIEISLITIK